jgi:hypothetical protein
VVCVPQWPKELCWRERKLLVEPPVPKRSKGRGETKCILWSSVVGVGHGTNDPAAEKFTVAELWRRPAPTQRCTKVALSLKQALEAHRLWDVEVPTFSRQSAHRWRWGCQPYAPAALYLQEDSWYSFLLEDESTPWP